MNEGASCEEPQQDGQWRPNPEFLQSLMNMGIQRAAAETALQLTGNQSAELAASFLFDSEEDWGAAAAAAAAAAADDQVSQNIAQVGNSPDHWSSDVPTDTVILPSESAGPSKVVFVVNTGLSMGTGETAKQVAHAALGLSKKLHYQSAADKDAILHWEETSENITVVCCRNGVELKHLNEKADSLNVSSCIIHATSSTQVAPNSATVLGIFGPEKDVDEITGSLPLL